MNLYLKSLIFCNTIFVFADTLFAPLYALFVIKLGGNAQIAGILFGTRFAATTITEFFVIRMGDRARLDENMLKLNYIIRGFSWLFLFFHQSLPTLFLVQVFVGIGEAFGSPAFNSLISENLDNKKHIREWGIWGIVSNPAMAIAGLVGGFIVTLFGFPPLFFLMAILSFTAALIIQLIKKGG